MKNLFKMSDLSNDEIIALIKRALALKNGAKPKEFKQVYCSNLFFENSTRTKLSFEIAQKKLNCNVIAFDSDHSSIQKGETLYDTCKTLECLGVKLVVIRHQQDQYYEVLNDLNLAIINGGDGTGEHPSQCLLDLMTIYETFNTFENLNVAIIGDIKHSRVANSNYEALKSLGANVEFIAPPTLSNEKTRTIDEVIDKVDVCMLLRIQLERHTTIYRKEDYLNQYGLTKARYQRLKPNAIIMHPAPVNRDVEIESSLVESEKSKIFTQMANGVYMRMAIIEKVLGE